MKSIHVTDVDQDLYDRFWDMKNEEGEDGALNHDEAIAYLLDVYEAYELDVESPVREVRRRKLAAMLRSISWMLDRGEISIGEAWTRLYEQGPLTIQDDSTLDRL